MKDFKWGEVGICLHLHVCERLERTAAGCQFIDLHAHLDFKFFAQPAKNKQTNALVQIHSEKIPHGGISCVTLYCIKALHK